MIQILPFEVPDIETLLAWHEARDAHFLMQWAGSKYEFPLTTAQIRQSMERAAALYKIVLQDEMIGTIQLISIDSGTASAHFGGFLFNPSLQGKGWGTKALNLFCLQVFEAYLIDRLTLYVYAFNQSAIRCYLKNGFSICRQFTADNGYETIMMELQRADFFSRQSAQKGNPQKPGDPNAAA